MPLTGTKDYVESLIELNKLLLDNMIILMDVPEDAKTLTNFFFIVNWASRDTIDFIMMEITKTAKDAFEKLPHVPISKETIKGVKEEVKMTEVVKLEF